MSVSKTSDPVGSEGLISHYFYELLVHLIILGYI